MGIVRRIAGTLALAGALLLSGPLAAAEEPLSSVDPVTDQAQVLSASEEEQLRTSLNRLQDETDYAVRFVFVNRFDGAGADQWPIETFNRAGLSSDATLIAVAVDSRQLGYAYGRASFSASDLDKAFTAEVRKAYRDGRWLEGSLAYTRELAQGEETDWASLALGGGAVVVIIGAIVFVRARKRKQAENKTREDLAVLGKRAAAALLATDDGVRSAAAELNFARAQFGVNSVRGFDQALAQAQQYLQEAFNQRQLLDDDIPDTPEQVRSYNTAILELTEKAQRAITEQEEEFARLRDLAANVEEAAARVREGAADIRANLPSATRQLDSLAATYGENAVASFRTYPADIEALLAGAEDALGQVDQLLGTGERNQAVPFVRIAEQALDEAAERYRAISNVQESVNRAFAQLGEHISSISADIADAHRIGGGNAQVGAARDRAEAMVEKYRGERVDPLAGIRELTEAENALDAALAPARDAEENYRRQVAGLERDRQRARAAVQRAEAMVSQNRWSTGNEARAPLEAARTALQAGDTSDDLAKRRDYYARAESYAQRATDAVQEAMSARAAGGFGGNGGNGGNGGGDVGSLLLGMFLGSLTSGGSRHNSGWGSGWGSGFGGERSSGFGGGFGGFGGGSGGGFGGFGGGGAAGGGSRSF
ncbi:TPM domain-containing protein [Actinotignum sp. GS-2025b]|uniref:TPM domain-containing protein n=1 Tax=Actinotignum sp. GS-2025b TaxID=3427275 RepID=UPI003F459E8D